MWRIGCNLYLELCKSEPGLGDRAAGTGPLGVRCEQVVFD